MNQLPRQLRGLLGPAAYAHPARSIELVETPLSWVILTGAFAYKIKRPVHYPFVDQRDPAERERLCHAELAINRRFAPELYLEVCPIVVTDGEARIGGAGTPIEHAVRMRQFAREEELDRLLARGRIDAAELEDFGEALWRRHQALPAASDPLGWGGPQQARRIVLANANECIAALQPLGRGAAAEALVPPLAARLDHDVALLDARLRAGHVRECHGDLHAANIVRLDGRLVPFDGLEFDPALRWSDVASEVAFLVADLEARGHDRLARAFLQGYLDAGGDYALCGALRLFKAHRALVRAKVTALGATGAAALAKIDAYLECARCALVAPVPPLVVMCGLSGSGKTWLASQLAPLLRAIHLRSDVERKRLAGRTARERTASGVGEGLYAHELTERVYARLAECAGHVLADGYPAIVDATFATAANRARLKECARKAGAAAWLIECRAPAPLLRERIAERLARGSDPSEATLEVLAAQERGFEPVRPEEGWSMLAAELPSSAQVAELAHRIA